MYMSVKIPPLTTYATNTDNTAVKSACCVLLRQAVTSQVLFTLLSDTAIRQGFICLLIAHTQKQWILWKSTFQM